MTEQELRKAVGDTELPPLLAALAMWTGDVSFIDESLRPPLPKMSAVIAPQGGMSAQAQASAKELIVSKLLAFSGEKSALPAADLSQLLNQCIAFITGGASAEYLPMLQHELAIDKDHGKPAWTKAEMAADREFKVAIIGAGASGLAAAHRLKQAGIPFVIFEKNDEVGGTWLENIYPGCRLDTPNFAYSFSFDQKEDWPEQFSKQDEILGYFTELSKSRDLRQYVRFNTSVKAARYLEAEERWEITIVDAQGMRQTLFFNAIVCATGQLNVPSIPDIKGADKYTGLAIHSAQWPQGLDLTGKRVGVVGTGASAYQIVPAIASEVGSLKVFQRNAPWMLPTPNYYEAIAPGMQALFAAVPGYARWFRFWQFWTSVEGRMHFAQVDPSYPGPHAVSEPNEFFRSQLLDEMRKQYADRPDLLEKVTPTYPPGAKRLLRDNGVWAQSLKRENVELVTEGISHFEADGLVTQDGRSHELDVIIYATGFKASDFLGTIDVSGVDGTKLSQYWAGDAKAYLGINVPKFPNLFLLYGPNTGLVVNGSILFMVECAVEYTMECLRELLQKDAAAFDCTQEALDDFIKDIDAANAAKVWGAAAVSSWYKNSNGRVSQNWPHSLLRYWELTRTPDLKNYHLRRSELACADSTQ